MREHFPKHEGEQEPEISRRSFLTFLGATAAAALMPEKKKSDSATGRGENADKDQLVPDDLREMFSISPEALRVTEKYGKYMHRMFGIMNRQGAGESRPELGADIWNEVDRVFSGPLEPLRAWNREVVENGRYLHIVTYLLQDFRNSPAATELAQTYKNLNQEQRSAFEKSFAIKLGSGEIFDLLFKLGLRPTILDPRDVPGNIVKEEPIKVDLRTSTGGSIEEFPKPFYDISDQNHRRVFWGADNVPSPTQGMGGFVYNGKGQHLFCLEYFISDPRLHFYHYDEKGEVKEQHEYLKMYLGFKGKFFWYSIGGSTDQERIFESPEFTDEQLDALVDFFDTRRDEDRPYFRTY